MGGIAVQEIAAVGVGIPGVVDIRTGSSCIRCQHAL